MKSIFVIKFRSKKTGTKPKQKDWWKYALRFEGRASNEGGLRVRVVERGHPKKAWEIFERDEVNEVNQRVPLAVKVIRKWTEPHPSKEKYPIDSPEGIIGVKDEWN